MASQAEAPPRREIDMTTDQDAMYVEGRDLDDVVTTGGPMLVEHAVDCLIQAARGIEAAHALGIIHRDIRPGNLVFDATGTVRVLNLGLTHTIDANNPLRENAVAGLTQNGMDTGTVDYMAPEQAEESGRVDHRADIYSLGCTLYFLLTSREPFPGETVSKKIVAHREQEAPSLRAARPDVSMALEACYQKMLAKRPEDRPGSMTDVIALLLASKLPPGDVTSEPVPPSKGRSENKDEPSINARREERVGLAINDELNLQYQTDVRHPVRLARPDEAANHRGAAARADCDGGLARPFPAHWRCSVGSGHVCSAAGGSRWIHRNTPRQCRHSERGPAAAPEPRGAREVTAPKDHAPTAGAEDDFRRENRPGVDALQSGAVTPTEHPA